jgi:hypothetical protein
VSIWVMTALLLGGEVWWYLTTMPGGDSPSGVNPGVLARSGPPSSPSSDTESSDTESPEPSQSPLPLASRMSFGLMTYDADAGVLAVEVTDRGNPDPSPFTAPGGVTVRIECALVSGGDFRTRVADLAADGALHPEQQAIGELPGENLFDLPTEASETAGFYTLALAPDEAWKIADAWAKDDVIRLQARAVSADGVDSFKAAPVAFLPDES